MFSSYFVLCHVANCDHKLCVTCAFAG